VSYRRGLLFSIACLASLLGACRTEPAPKTPESRAAAPRSDPVSFRYEGVEKGTLDSGSLRGRPAVIIFITTYDIASQAQARFLTMVERRLRSRIGAAAIMLEPSDNRPLVLAFRDALHLDYPVAWGDDDLSRGHGPFGDVRAVPTTIVLDAAGRIAWRNVGLVKDTDIEAALSGL